VPLSRRTRPRPWVLVVAVLLWVLGAAATPASAETAPATSPIQAAYAASGGAAGPLGAATSAETCGLPQGGCTQSFEHGTYYWRSGAGAHHVLSGVLSAGHAAAGGPGGVLGYPRQDTGPCPGADGSCRQQFENGWEIWSPATGAHAVPDVVSDRPFTAVYRSATLGYPTSEVDCTLRGAGCVQAFQHGAVYLGPTEQSGVEMDDGPIRTAWEAAGAQDGTLGYPARDLACGTDQLCAQLFDSGTTLTTSPTTGVHRISGEVSNRWYVAGGVQGSLGAPTDDTFSVGEGYGQDFQHGSVYGVGQTTRIVRYALLDEWTAWGRLTGMGWPQADEQCGLVGNGCLQRFGNGGIYWSPATGAKAVRGALGSGFRGMGEQNSGLGYPVTEQGCGKRANGCSQEFQGGTLLWSGASGTGSVRGALRDEYRSQGWENGRLGYPVGGEACGKRDGGCAQEFQGGTELWSPTSGAHSVLGALRSEYASVGWENGVLGYPVADEACGKRGGGCSQEFQGGTLLWSPTTGAHLVTGSIRSTYAARGWENSSYGYPVADPRPVAARATQSFQGGTITG
jgi:uncharacterized protein with LGFP repeats